MRDNSHLYGRKFTIKSGFLAECWNHPGAEGVFVGGEVIEVECAYDATHTTVFCPTDNDGRPVYFPLAEKGDTPVRFSYKAGDDVRGYRFIVPNKRLKKAIGEAMHLTTGDLIGDLIAYETGTSTPEQDKRLFKTLRETGIGQKLQGHYSRQM